MQRYIIVVILQEHRVTTYFQKRWQFHHQIVPLSVPTYFHLMYLTPPHFRTFLCRDCLVSLVIPNFPSLYSAKTPT